MTWTINDSKDLSGKLIIVTGANSGLGFEATKLFVSKNAKVIMACRSIERANEAKTRIEIQYKNADLEIMELNLGDLESVKSFANKFKSKYSKIDVLLNNAGVMTTPYIKTKDGFELQNGINHLGHFALTALLFDTIKNTKNSRIVNVSSIAHKFAKLDLEDYLFENKKYDKNQSYAQSKLSNLLFTYELDRLVQEHNLDVKVLAAHPGVSSTELGRHLKTNKVMKFFASIFTKFGQHPSKGTLPQVRASLDVNALSGDYYGPSGLFEMRGKPVLVKPKKKAKNIENAKRLWKLSEELTNIKFTV